MNTNKPNRLEQLLKSLVITDSIIIVGCQKNSLPVPLSGTYSTSNRLDNQVKFNTYYYYEPFYSKYSKACIEGIYVNHDLSQQGTNTAQNSQVESSCSELVISIKLTQNRWVSVYLRRHNSSVPFSQKEIDLLTVQYRTIKLICKSMWPDSWSERKECDDGSLANTISVALSTFGKGMLSPREHEISTLVVLGLENSTIAEKLKISVSTVKVHRKSIYAKLEVASMGELYHKFFNHMLFLSYPWDAEANKTIIYNL